MSLLHGPSTGRAEDVEAQRGLINSGTVRIMSGSYESTDLRLAVDLADALDDGYEMRVIPMVGKGSARNVEDLLYLQGVDLAIVQSDVLDFYRRNELISNIDQRLRYIAKLHDDEVHLLARAEFPELDDLAGRRVNFGVEGSGTFMTAGIVFEDLGLEVEATTLPQGMAFQKLKAGELDAMILVDGAPSELVAGLKAADGLQLIPIPPGRVSSTYLPAQLTAEHYPELVKSYAPVETVAVGEVLAAYNWPEDTARAATLRRFVDRFFAQFERLLAASYHPKWREVDLAEELPGWQRVPSAQAATRQVVAAVNDYGEYLSYECVACHQPTADSGAIPVIAALPSQYFVNALKSYRAGQRSNLVMEDVARSLSDEQIDALAAYYASLKEVQP
jgi:TRAP transporter TAXI family solute receptor